MSVGYNYLHSHSGLERELRFPKHTVLVDAKFEETFADCVTKPFSHKGHNYLKVNILTFVKKGGTFKNLFY